MKGNINIELENVESSQIKAIGFDSAQNILAIQFKKYNGDDGGIYHYQNFTAEQFQQFKSAESIGRYFKANIKSEVEKHPYKKIQ